MARESVAGRDPNWLPRIRLITEQTARSIRPRRVELTHSQRGYEFREVSFSVSSSSFVLVLVLGGERWCVRPRIQYRPLAPSLDHRQHLP